MAHHSNFRFRQESAVTDASTISETYKGTSTHNHQASSIKGSSEKESVSYVDRVITREDVSLASFAHLDARKINRRIDLRIVPMVTILYLLSFLDRGNIGNAKIEGMYEDLRLTDAKYKLCLTVFFFTYALVEVPSNMMLKKFRPSVWLPTIMVAWGTVMTLMGLVQNFHGLLSARIFLGITEGGLAPGITFFLTCWYPRYEVQTRNALYFSAACVAGAFSGLLAYGISFMDGVGDLAGWRWIFILEGLATVVVAVSAYFLLFDYPDTASFLSPEERAFVAYRLKYDGQDETGVRVPQCDTRDKRFIKEAFCDWQVYTAILANFGLVVPLYGVSLSMPTIIKDMGYVSTTAQLMTVPVYSTAAVITVSFALGADRLRMRSPFLFTAYFLELLGFALCVTGGPAHRTYGGLFLVCCGAYAGTPCVVTMLTNNLAGSYKRAVGVGILVSFAAMGGAMASNFYRKTDAPEFILGHALNIGFVCLGLISTCFWVWNYRRINKQRAVSIAAGDHLMFTPEELSVQGDRAVTFRYTT
ncbi:related to putative tartrate transporter [Ramularia collo-cygni]|uniref:Related to putative tartrate transporter n=1 Tax=Ramularia collo-cygni TaxID=112498 RepID=A0A2D3V5D3_9PEZI|nr:related to putative tartrate transporter [Ramularia collo-cygni]CZT20660.1 related to putative tartrate transporter [Ramularia collo-cygni]